MKRRTFLEYAKDYSREDFNNYARLFINWSEVNGYISRCFSNNVYACANDKIYISKYWDFKGFKEVSEKFLEEYTQKINEMGYRTEFFQDNKDALVTEIKNIEKEFCEIFLGILFKKTNRTYKGVEESTIDEVIASFKAFQCGRIFKNEEEADFFWTNFEDFLRYIPYGDKKIDEKKYGYALVRNLNHDWMDIGVVIYNREYLSRQILFYQIGDSN